MRSPWLVSVSFFINNILKARTFLKFNGKLFLWVSQQISVYGACSYHGDSLFRGPTHFSLLKHQGLSRTRTPLSPLFYYVFWPPRSNDTTCFCNSPAEHHIASISEKPPGAISSPGKQCTRPGHPCDVKEKVIHQTEPPSPVAPWFSSEDLVPIVGVFGGVNGSALTVSGICATVAVLWDQMRWANLRSLYTSMNLGCPWLVLVLQLDYFGPLLVGTTTAIGEHPSCSDPVI